jgi:predicted MFS family arabinose efflux permease
VSPTESARAGPLTTAVTGGMVFALQLLFVVAALAPFIISDIHASRSLLGSLITASYATTVGLSLLTGHFVDGFGGRRSLVLLLLTVVASQLIASLAPGLQWLLVSAVVAGVARALALPSTNKLVRMHLTPRQQSLAIGVKQSGVQMGALVAGLLLPALAVAIGWRAAMGVLAVAPLAWVVVALLTIPADPRSKRQGLLRLPAAPNRLTRWLMAYSFFLGCGTAAATTFLPLYAHEALHLSAAYAGHVLAALGVSAVVARIAWTVLSDRMSDATMGLVLLSVVAVAFTLIVWLAEPHGIAMLWLGALGLGASAVAGNAVSTLIVVRENRAADVGHASALVGLSYFAGFVASPPVFGALTDGTGSYSAGWLLVGTLFAAAGIVATGRLREGARGGGRTTVPAERSH